MTDRVKVALLQCSLYLSDENLDTGAGPHFRNSWDQGGTLPLSVRKTQWLSEAFFFFPCHKAKQPWMLTTAGEWGFRKFLVGEREKWNTRSLCKERDHRCPCEVGMCLHGTHPGLLSHDLRPLACPNSPAPEGNAACTCDSCSPYTFSFCFRLEKTLPSFDPFKTLPQPLSHICFSRRKNIIKSFTLLHCIIVRNSVLFVNAWSDIHFCTVWRYFQMKHKRCQR